MLNGRHINVRDIRTTFLEKHVDYACSIDAQLELDVSRSVHVPLGVRVVLAAASPADVFHVRELQRVTAPDGKAHDAPLGVASGHQQTIVFTGDMSGAVEGRMTLEPRHEAARIDLRYRGVLQLSAHPSGITAQDRVSATLEGRTFVQATFETLHPKYHWLTERVCVAFGTWIAHPRQGATRRVVQRYDVYSTG